MKASELIALLQRIQSHTGHLDTEIILSGEGLDRDIKLDNQSKQWNAKAGHPPRPAAWLFTSQFINK